MPRTSTLRYAMITAALAVVVALGFLYEAARRERTVLVEPSPGALEAAPIPRRQAATESAAAPDPNSGLGRSDFVDVPTERTGGAGGAVIDGEVVDQFGTPLPSGDVRLERISVASTEDDGPAPSAQIVAGRFRLIGVLPGDYDVVLPPEALPPNVLPPFEQRLRTTEALAAAQGAGFFATPVLVENESDRRSVRLQVWRAVRVFGRVLTTAARPVEDATVRLRSLGAGMQAATVATQTDALGNFVFERAMPGFYRVHVELVGAAEEFRRLSHPVPADVEVPRDVAEFEVPTRYVGGDVNAVGRVVNVEGEPYADGLVLCVADPPVTGAAPPHDWTSETQRTRTDARGRYKFEGLPRGRFKIVIEPEGFLPGREFPANRLVAHGPQLDVDLSSATAETDFGTQVVDESRPFRLRGSVSAVADAGRSASDFDRLEVVVTPVSGGVNRRPALGRPEPAESRVRLDAQGRFEWWCETPYPEVDVRVVVVAGGPSGIARRVTPRPRESVEVELSRP